MRGERLWHTLRMSMYLNAVKRTEWARKKKIYGSMGENVMIQSRIIPLYPKLIRFHNNIQIASNVFFSTHDVIHIVFKNSYPEIDFQEHLGCIEIMDNVFIGTNSLILYNVRIGPNAIVAAGSVVTKDVPPGTIVGGVPAKVIGSFSQLFEERITESSKQESAVGTPT
jgi:acetyltransferase-like isoleucine patch superfamily enzyme